MRTLIPLLALVFAACGPAPRPAVPALHQSEGPAAAEPTQGAGAGPQDASAGPAGPTQSPAAPRPAALVHLEGLPDRQIAQAAHALTPQAAQAALAAAEADHPARPWLQLRVARAAIDQGQDAEGRRLLDALAASAPPADVQAAAQAERARLADRLPTTARKIALLLPLSGPYAAIGRGARQAVELALSQRPGVQVVVADTRGEADEAARQVEALVREQGVVGILGPVGQIESAAAAKVAQRLRVPLLTLSSAPDLTDVGDHVFRHRMTRKAQARYVARHACEQLGIKRFAILYPQTDYGRRLMRAFWAAVEACGGEIRGAQGYAEDTKDFAEPIKKLIGRWHLGLRKRSRHWEALNRKARDKALHVPPEVDFEAIYIPDGGGRAGLILPFLKYWDIELRTARWLDPATLAAKYEGVAPSLVQVIGSSGFNSRAFLRRAGDLAHNALFVDAFWPTANPAAEAFAQAYQAKTGRAADALAAHAHDAALMLARAAAGGGDRPAVRTALAAARHQGVFGPVQVQPDGDVAFWPVLLTVLPGHGIALRQDDLRAQDEDAPEGL
ncbi:MAG: penicillin-binding protein activator [Myxococcales bacterium]|nr:penicillin-binding protein activator [Myxococcales bacterium]